MVVPFFPDDRVDFVKFFFLEVFAPFHFFEQFSRIPCRVPSLRGFFLMFQGRGRFVVRVAYDPCVPTHILSMMKHYTWICRNRIKNISRKEIYQNPQYHRPSLHSNNARAKVLCTSVLEFLVVSWWSAHAIMLTILMATF